MKKRVLWCVLMCLMLLPPVNGTPGRAAGADAGDKWAARMDLPGREEIGAFKPGSRSPYIVLRPEFEGCEQFSEYAVDFRMDHLPNGTYLAVCNWDLDVTGLKRTYAKVYRDHPGVAAYAGFQVERDGTHSAIMSVWDTRCEARTGQKKTIEAAVTYPQQAGRRFDDEGSGTQCVVPYDWREGRSYRALIQKTYSPERTVLLTFWACDLETGAWTELIQFDTRLSDTTMMTACAFLENYFLPTAGEIRSAEMWNFRACSQRTGQWVGAAAGTFSRDYDWSGSYRYGSEGNVYWAVTTGLPGRCEAPQQNLRCTVSGCDTGSPY